MRSLFRHIAVAACIVALGTPSAFASDTLTQVAQAMAPPVTCPAGQTLVKGYTKKDGTKVAAYCKASKSKSMMMGGSKMSGMAMTKCPPGKKYVKGYTKKDGTKVEGYCRS